MSHFYGTLQGGRGEATRCGTRNSGMAAVAASWAGCIRVTLYHDDKTGDDRFYVHQDQWRNGAGCREVIAEGIVGKPCRTCAAEFRTAIRDAKGE